MAKNPDGTYSQVGFIKDADGNDVEFVKDKNEDVIFEKGFPREKSGTLPLQLDGIRKPLKNYTIYGDTMQNGTPTPDNPVEVHAVGDRTANLFDKTSDIVDFYISSETGVYTATTGNSRSILIKCSPKTTYTVYVPTNATLRMVTFDQYPTSGDIGSDYIHKPTDYYVDKTLSITTGTTAQYLCIFCYNSVQEATQYDENEYFSQIMLNEGETALPYEPHGYKITITTESEDGSESITTTAYLDKPLYKISDYADSINYTEQEADRVVKELVLTGEEGWQLIDNCFRLLYSDILDGEPPVFCSHFNQVTMFSLINGGNGISTCGNYYGSRYKGFAIRYDDLFTTANDFKAFLAEQYAAGAPVTVYYVLTEPETKSVTLPKIPTLDGVTVIDVLTEIKPSKMDIKYKGV